MRSFSARERIYLVIRWRPFELFSLNRNPAVFLNTHQRGVVAIARHRKKKNREKDSDGRPAIPHTTSATYFTFASAIFTLPPASLCALKFCIGCCLRCDTFSSKFMFSYLPPLWGRLFLSISTFLSLFRLHFLLIVAHLWCRPAKHENLLDPFRSEKRI